MFVGGHIGEPVRRKGTSHLDSDLKKRPVSKQGPFLRQFRKDVTRRALWEVCLYVLLRFTKGPESEDAISSSMLV